jgi:hypothetical protein
MSAFILITCKMSVWLYAFPNMPNFGQGNALLYAFPNMPCVLVFSMHYTMFPVLYASTSVNMLDAHSTYTEQEGDRVWDKQ